MSKLVSRNGTDVSKIAEKFQGGGHKAAAGFSILESDFYDLMRYTEE